MVRRSSWVSGNLQLLDTHPLGPWWLGRGHRFDFIPSTATSCHHEGLPRVVGGLGRVPHVWVVRHSSSPRSWTRGKLPAELLLEGFHKKDIFRVATQLKGVTENAILDATLEESKGCEFGVELCVKGDCVKLMNYGCRERMCRNCCSCSYYGWGVANFVIERMNNWIDVVVIVLLWFKVLQ
jgi:hypothetical protein